MHSDELFDDEISLVRGIPVTTAARTAFDLGRRYGLTLAVIRLDALIQATDVKTVDIDVLIDRHRGPRGIVQLREAIGLADAGAESPQETRTRLVLTAAGLRPQRTQIDVSNRFATISAATWAGTTGRSPSNTAASWGHLPLAGDR